MNTDFITDRERYCNRRETTFGIGFIGEGSGYSMPYSEQGKSLPCRFILLLNIIKQMNKMKILSVSSFSIICLINLILR